MLNGDNGDNELSNKAKSTKTTLPKQMKDPLNKFCVGASPWDKHWPWVPRNPRRGRFSSFVRKNRFSSDISSVFGANHIFSNVTKKLSSVIFLTIGNATKNGSREIITSRRARKRLPKPTKIFFCCPTKCRNGQSIERATGAICVPPKRGSLRTKGRFENNHALRNTLSWHN